MPYKIRTKLIIAFLAIIFPFIAIVGAIALYNANVIRKASLKAEAISEELHAVLSLQLAIDKSLMPGNDYIITGDKRYIDEFNVASKDVEDLLKKVEALLTALKGMETPEVKEKAEMLKFTKTAWQNIKEVSQKIFEIPNPVGNREAARLMGEMDYKWAYPAIKMLDRHHEIDRKEYSEAVEALQRGWRTAWIIMIGGAVILVSFGTFFALFYSRLFTTPIQAIHNGADAIAKGDFKTRLDVQTGDEIEQLSNAMNEMAAQLDSFYGTLERKVEERTRELQYERDKLIKVFEAMEDGVYIVNRQYDIEYLNPVILKEFGSIEGRKCYTYFHDRTDICPWCPNQRVWAGETVRWEWYSFKNGKTYDLIDTPLRQPDGSVWKLEIFRDITDKKKAEKELQETEERYRGIFEKMPNAMVVFDAETWRFENVNRAEIDLYGYTEEEFLSMTPADVSAEVEKTRKSIENGLAEKSAHVPVRYHKKKDGTVFPIEIFMGTFLSGGRQKGFAVIVDLTDKKKAEDKIKEQMDYLVRFEKATVQREFRMKELRERVKELEGELKKVKG